MSAFSSDDRTLNLQHWWSPEFGVTPQPSGRYPTFPTGLLYREGEIPNKMSTPLPKFPGFFLQQLQANRA
jgi:hypothetical protein